MHYSLPSSLKFYLKMRLLGLLVCDVLGHGRLMDPPGRSSEGLKISQKFIKIFLCR